MLAIAKNGAISQYVCDSGLVNLFQLYKPEWYILCEILLNGKLLLKTIIMQLRSYY